MQAAHPGPAVPTGGAAAPPVVAALVQVAGPPVPLAPAPSFTSGAGKRLHTRLKALHAAAKAAEVAAAAVPG